jgi:flagellar basal body rod protein FlgC
MVPHMASRLPPPPPPPNMVHEPPHPAIPRTGWVTYPAINRQGEAVR